ncbi:hypothetical protein [Sphingomonas sp. ERG5]|uniref:hypothetical protein n=1 Tax=Sphingomonas sp. ERG5 TaxID=1381597 RepID=UPI00054C4758|nr:hypothetical protein [Sphingomonas sp. ERG5]
MSIHITDHALLLYLELIEGIEIERMRGELEERFNRLQVAAHAMGGGDYTIRHKGHQLIVRAGKVTTVLPPLGGPARFDALKPQNG